MNVLRVTTTIRINEELHEKLSKIAAKEVRSVNNLMEYVRKIYPNLNLPSIYLLPGTQCRRSTKTTRCTEITRVHGSATLLRTGS
jgi:hypothetical protein